VKIIEGLHIENEKLKTVLNLRTVVELVELGIIPRTADKAQLIVDLIKEYLTVCMKNVYRTGQVSASECLGYVRLFHEHGGYQPGKYACKHCNCKSTGKQWEFSRRADINSNQLYKCNV